MTRRSWLKSASQLLGGGGEEGYFFGVQLLIHAFGEDTLRARLAEVIADPDGTLEDTQAKRRYLKRVVALLIEQEPYWSQVFGNTRRIAKRPKLSLKLGRQNSRPAPRPKAKR